MPFELLQPQAGGTVTYPVLVEWVNNPIYEPNNFYLGVNAWTALTPADYTCEYTCYMWVTPPASGASFINMTVLDSGTPIGAIGTRTFTVTGYASDGGGQVITEDPNTGTDPDPSTDGSGGSGGTVTGVVTLASDASVTLDSGMSVTQMEDVGGTVMLCLTIAFCFRMLRDQIQNRR